jgi:pre-rRNA-processing protein TSR4
VPNPFGLGSQIFQSSPITTPLKTAASSAEDKTQSQEDQTEPETDGVDHLVTAMAATTLENSDWAASPSYSALYLSTVSEYLPPAPKTKLSRVNVEDADADAPTGGGGWAPEGYENSLDTDHVFDRFSTRVNAEPSQCLRFVLLLLSAEMTQTSLQV